MLDMQVIVRLQDRGARCLDHLGSGLNNGTSGSSNPPDVTFGGLTATVKGNWTDTLVHVTLPPGIADVQVITSDGRTATLPNAFECTP